jgi:hypothetical protein
MKVMVSDDECTLPSSVDSMLMVFCPHCYFCNHGK